MSGLLSESVHEGEGQQPVMVKGPHLHDAFVQLVYIGDGIAQWRSTVKTYVECLLYEEDLRKDAALFMAFSKLLENRMRVVEVRDQRIIGAGDVVEKEGSESAIIHLPDPMGIRVYAWIRARQAPFQPVEKSESRGN